VCNHVCNLSSNKFESKIFYVRMLFIGFRGQVRKLVRIECIALSEGEILTRNHDGSHPVRKLRNGADPP